MPERYLLTADSGHVALIRRDAGAAVCRALVPVESSDAKALLAAFESALVEAAVEGGTAEVWLGSAWARLLAMEWPKAHLDRVEREALLAHHWAAVLPEPNDWQLLVAERGSPRLSVAIPRSVVDSLGALLARRRVATQSLLPAVCGALQAAAVNDGAVMLDEGGRVTLVQCDGGEVRVASSRRVVPGEDLLSWAGGLIGAGPVKWLGSRPGTSDPVCVAWGGLWV